jgi:putative heme-binding domain-containing protein
MVSGTFSRTCLLALCLILPGVVLAEDVESQKRFPTHLFPPLRVPPGFTATLFACDPLVEYPSAAALGPRPGTLFVAHDYMTGLGTEIVRRDEIRLLEDVDGDGRADRSTLYAGGFNSIEGLEHDAGVVYAMHAPFLTALRDLDGDGIADERRDLVSGLGLPPEDNPVRLHAANGVAAGHDGWLYLALGDHGCDVARPEGDRLVHQGGAILRCRPDGRGLHVFASGLRNIYDVALDEELNVFVRDNENDGGDYKIRVCHSFFGADHGYPYLYHERPEEALAPLADLGLGSSAGVACYLETAFPEELRGSLFTCEWGRAVMTYRRQRAGATFATHAETEFAAGDPSDPYGFKPTALVVDRDGSLLVADWADGQRPKRGRGRIYRIRWQGALPEAPRAPDALDAIARLDSPGLHARVEAQRQIEASGAEGRTAVLEALRERRLGVLGRLHAVWLLARGGEAARSIDDLFRLAESDAEPRVRAQALRALADLLDPVLVAGRLDAGPGDARQAERVAALAARGADPRVQLEAMAALARLKWPGLARWLRANLESPDRALAHAAMQALRRAGDWRASLALLDEPEGSPLPAIALRALALQWETEVVDALAARLGTERRAERRRDYADLLARVWKQPGPWVYWGYRPAPRPANSVAWERTEAIETALDRALRDPDLELRAAALARLGREGIPAHVETLGRWLEEDRDPARVAAILAALGRAPPPAARGLLAAVVRAPDHGAEIRLAALAMLVSAPGEERSRAAFLSGLAAALEDGPVLAAALRGFDTGIDAAGERLLAEKLRSPAPEVRAAALDALARLRIPGSEASRAAVVELLGDADERVRLAAAAAAGPLGARAASGALLELAASGAPALRSVALESLRLLREPRAVPLALRALLERESALAALECLGDLGGPEHAAAVLGLAANERSRAVLGAAAGVLRRWEERAAAPAEHALVEDAAARLQGESGILFRWKVAGAAPERLAYAVGASWRLTLPPADAARRAAADVAVEEESLIELLASSSGPLAVSLNGAKVFESAAGTPPPAAVAFEARLARGANRVAVEIAAGAEAWLELSFRRRHSSAARERLAQLALKGGGSAARGREVFFGQKARCSSCHRLGSEGGRIGPALTGAGSRFSRIHLVESILDPNRALAPSYETAVAILRSGEIIVGVRVAETETALTLGLAEGAERVIARDEVQELRVEPRSIMPEDLAEQLSAEELVDVVEFLAGERG